MKNEENEKILSTSGKHLGGGLLESKRKTLGGTEKKILLTLTILCLFAIITTISYAFISYNTKQIGTNIIETDCMRIEMEELTNAIRLTNAYPVLDEVGEKTRPFRFKITNTCGVGVNYNVNLEVMDTEKRIHAKNIAVKVDENNKSILNGKTTATPTYQEEDYTAVEAYTVHSGEIKPYGNVVHEIRIWLDESAGNDSQNGSFYSKVVIDARQNQIVAYTEEILNGADPVLANNLVPVKIDENGVVKKANVYEEWYSYEKKIWANAVILSDKTKTYKDYEVIPEENIESYFVWIPKYSYQLWDLGEYEGLTEIDETKPHVIPIKFGLNNTNDDNEGECTTPMTSGSSGNCKIGDYMTPPAFITMGTNGLWVGKFETGYKEATSTTGAEKNTNEPSKVQIKPNVYSWRNIQVSNAFYTSYNYQRELDSHMMKNTEWGAVAYLQHSAYGSATSVRINNNSAYITGYAAKNEPTTGYTGTNVAGNKYESTSLGVDGTNTYNYKNPLSQVASTTGNYSGIYDMSGGVHEYMMSVRGTITAGSAGFNGSNTPAEKYYDIYSASSTQTTYQYRILGDATAEFGPFANKTYGSQTRQIGSWYSDDGWFVDSTNPWFKRGGYYVFGLGAGVFDFNRGPGGADSIQGFRVVLAV